MTKDELLGIRDPLGVRPLCIGKFHDGWVLASESCALDHIGAQFIREVEPGVYLGKVWFGKKRILDFALTHRK